MKRNTWKTAIASMMVIAMTAMSLPLQILSGLTGSGSVVFADDTTPSYVEVGVGGVVRSRTFTPFNGDCRYGYSEQIYTSGELEGLETIGAVAFCVSSGMQSMYGQIYLLETDKTQFSGVNDVVPIDNATLVYDGELAFGESGWVILTFPESFTRQDLAMNLMVICVNETGDQLADDEYLPGGLAFSCYRSGAQALYHIQDDKPEFNYPTAGSSADDTESYKPKMRFYAPMSSYTLTYDSNNGSGFSNEQTVSGGVDYEILGCTYENENMIFQCWNTQANGQGNSYQPGDTIQLTEDTVLYAQWIDPSYVTFFANNNTDVYTEQSFASGSNFQLNANTFEYAGHIFAGWNTKSDGSGVSYADGENVSFSTDMELYAQWNEALTLTYMANNGTDDSVSQVFVKNTYIELKYNTFEYDEHIFAEWNTEADGSGESYTPGQRYSFSSGLTLYAIWSENASITYMANNGTDDFVSQGIYTNTNVQILSNTFEKEGYAFIHWNTQADGNGDTYTPGQFTSFSSDMTLYAQWSKQMQVNFEANDGSGRTATQGFSQNVGFYLSINPFTSQGNEFKGWNTEPDGTGEWYSAGRYVVFSDLVTLYAQWAQEDNYSQSGNPAETDSKHPISAFYNYSFSEQIYTPDEVGNISSIVAIAFDVSKELSNRKGEIWLLQTTASSFANQGDVMSLEGATKVFEGVFPFSQTGWMTITFDEPYDYDNTMNLVVITIDTSGFFSDNYDHFYMQSTTNNSSLVYFSDSVKVHPNNSLSGATGYVNKSKNVLRFYDSGIGKIEVTYDNNGMGPEKYTYSVTQGEFTLRPNPFAVPGYFFQEWNTEPGGTGVSYADGSPVTFTEDVTLYAQWVPCNAIEYYDGATRLLYENSNTTDFVIKGTTLTGSYFSGWNTSRDGTGTSYLPGESVTVNGKLVLYAQSNGGIYYDFSSSAQLDGWVFIDKDADGYNWMWAYNDAYGYRAHSGSGGIAEDSYTDGSVLISQSYVNLNQQALSPDNWAIAPVGTVDPNGTKTVSLWAVSQLFNGDTSENFAIYAAKAEDVDLSAPIDLDQWKQISRKYTVTSEYQVYTGDLSEFAGERVYVAIRHYDCNGQFCLNIDDVLLPFMDFGESLEGYSLSLDGDIGVNYYMSLDDEVVRRGTAQMVFTVPNGEKTEEQIVKLSEVGNPVAINGKNYYIFKCTISAKEMSSVITAQLMDGNNAGKKYTFSVKKYAKYILDHAVEMGTDGGTVSLVKALLNYGATAQTYFDVNTDDLANSILSQADQTEYVNVEADMIASHIENEINLPAGVTFAGATLSLKSETTLSLYFTCSSKYEIEFACSNKAIEQTTNGKYHVVRIRGISAAELAGSFTVTVTYRDNSGTITYNPMTYCYNVLNGDYDVKLQNICKALFHYWFAAKDTI